MLLSELAERWLQELDQRLALGKIKPASVSIFGCYVRNQIIPGLGALPVEEVRNGKLREFAESIAANSLTGKKGLAPKSVREVLVTTRMILSSHQNEDGEPLLDLSKLNYKFILKNCENIGRQKQPVATKDQVNKILRDKTLRVRDRVFLALLGCSGMRLGEVLTVRLGSIPDATCYDVEASVIHVRQSIWRGKLQAPKTPAAVRSIELSEPVNRMLQEFTKGRQPGELLFNSKNNTPLKPSYIRQYILTPLGIPGAHSLRRLRTSHLRAVGCNESVLRHWLGHSSNTSVTDLYDKSAEDAELRRTWVDRVGTGLDVSEATVVLSEPLKSKPSAHEKSRKPDWQASARSVRAAQASEERRRAALETPIRKAFATPKRHWIQFEFNMSIQME
jgi:integrase